MAVADESSVMKSLKICILHQILLRRPYQVGLDEPGM
jgi:hypothetical protein